MLLADVMGHGVPAALYTMFVSSLWQSHQDLLGEPAQFVQVLNDRLHALIQEDEPFAVALYGLSELKAGKLPPVGAGNPGPLLIRADGGHEQLVVTGMPLGLISGMMYDETVVSFASGDCVLLFTDEAVEATDSAGALTDCCASSATWDTRSRAPCSRPWKRGCLPYRTASGSTMT